jgi:hypothetical protein
VPDYRLGVLLVVTSFCKFVSIMILLFQIIDIVCVILDGLVFFVRVLVCQLAEEVSGLWVHLLFVWGGSNIVGMFGIGWLNVGFGVSPSHVDHLLSIVVSNCCPVQLLPPVVRPQQRELWRAR